MDFYYNDTTGKYLVTLGGEVWKNCTVDADCLGRAICAVNKTWSEFPNMCVCATAIGHTGARCEEVSSAGWFFYGGLIFAACIASIAICVGLVNVFRLIRWKRFQRDALSFSLAFALIGLFFVLLATAGTTRFVVQTITPSNEGSKEDTLFVATVAVPFAFLFSTLAMMNVSLVWIDIAVNADKVKLAKSSNIAPYRRFLISYYIIFLSLVCFLVGRADMVYASMVCLPGIVLVILTYAIGTLKMRKLLIDYVTSSDASDGLGSVSMGNKDASRKMRQSLIAIQSTAIGVCFFGTLFIVFLGVWALSGGYNERPGQFLGLIFLPLAWIAAAASTSILVWYMHGAIVRKGKAIAALSSHEGPSPLHVVTQRENYPQITASPRAARSTAHSTAA